MPHRLCVALALLTGCCLGEPSSPAEPASRVLALPSEVTNLTAVNSRFDDYNPIPPPGPGLFKGLYFSSNRSTRGGTFDFEYVDLQFHSEPGQPLVFQALSGRNGFAQQIQSRVNTPADEFGPNFVAESVETVPGVLSGDVAFLFARDDADAGALNVYLLRKPASTGHLADDAIPATGINSSANDAYPIVTADQSAIYFTSDRDGTFDLFVARAASSEPAPGVERAVALLTGSQTEVRPVAALNSDHDDKCPFVSGNRLIFTSDRPGGFGGFDLWISTLEDGEWSTPKNLGPRINSAHDEYRPILIRADEFESDLLVFSSNRPGGLGGFDLHYTEFPRGERGVSRPWLADLDPNE